MGIEREYFPSLRGRLGDWAYYSVLMTLQQVADRVNYAKEIHKSEKLSELIQRELDDKGRAGEIGNYILKNPDRFFSSLVIAIYDGDPEWHEFQNMKPISGDLDVDQLSYNARYSVGFLSFSGEEKLFALDGQHRLAGIRRALEEKPELEDEEVSVIIVAHHTSTDGLKRTRKLFTTLNKTAKPVSKSEIIALDEADAMAITARQLVERHAHFSDERVDVLRKQANLPPTDLTHLTTLINLYDILEILFVKTKPGANAPDIKRLRPSDEQIEANYQMAATYFAQLSKAFPSVSEYFEAKNLEVVVRKYRKKTGGHVLFRPVGLLVFTEVLAALMRVHGLTLAKAVAELKRLPTELTEYPYNGILWEPETKTMRVGGRAMVRELLLHYLNRNNDTKKIAKIRKKYAEILGGTTKDHPLRKLRS